MAKLLPVVLIPSTSIRKWHWANHLNYGKHKVKKDDKKSNAKNTNYFAYAKMEDSSRFGQGHHSKCCSMLIERCDGAPPSHTVETCYNECWYNKDFPNPPPVVRKR